MAGHPWVRPYVLTAGRTRGRGQLLMHTLVAVEGRYDPVFAAGLLPEARVLYERLCVISESVAELSAACGVPLGVTRVLLGDLAAAGRINIESETYDSPYDPRLLEQVIEGLRELV